MSIPPDTEPAATLSEGTEPAERVSSETDPTSFPRVDALFAGEPPPPPLEARVRLRRLHLILGLGLPLNLLAVPCCTGVPGAVLTLWAYVLADGETARIQAGQYTSEDAARLLRLQRLSTWMLYFCVVSFLAQVWLLSNASYLGYLSWCLELIINAFMRVWTVWMG